MQYLKKFYRVTVIFLISIIQIILVNNIYNDSVSEYAFSRCYKHRTGEQLTLKMLL